MESLQKTAIVTAIAIEVRSLSFYRAISAKVRDSRTKHVLELLAQEESEHLESFCGMYLGSANDLITILGKNSIDADPYYSSLIRAVDSNTTELDALRIALQEEQACIECYSVFAETIREPSLREVFARILHETRKHGELISEEYMRLMNMVDASEQDTYVRE